MAVGLLMSALPVFLSALDVYSIALFYTALFCCHACVISTSGCQHIFGIKSSSSVGNGIATGLSVCRLSSVCNVRALQPNGDSWTHDIFASGQGFQSGYARHPSKSVQPLSSSGGLSGPTLCSVLQTSAPASKRCEIGTWLLWNTIGKSIPDFQNPQKIWPWMTLKRWFQGHESENDQYRLNGCF